MSPVPFRGVIPDGLLYDAEHDMWVRREGFETVIGATAYGIFRAGEIIGFTAKPKGAEVDRGRGLGTVECAKTVLAVRSPVSLVLTEGNEAAEERPALINRDPYGAGWMARGPASAWEAERASLLDGAAYRAHVLCIEPQAEFQ